MNTPGKQRVLAISTLVGLAFMAACNNPPPSDQHLQEQAAQATENAKQASKEALERAHRYSKPIVTQIVPAVTFFPAEDYHQQYLEKRGMASCHIKA